MGSQRVGHDWVTNICTFLMLFTEVQTIQMSSMSPLMSCFYPGIQSRIPCCDWVYKSSWGQGQVPCFFVFMTLMVLKSMAQVFVRMSLSVSLSDAFLWLFWEEYHRGECVLIHSYQEEHARSTSLVLADDSSDKESACNAGNTGSIPGLGRCPGGGKWQPTSVFFPAKFPWTEESGRLQSKGSQRVRLDWVTKHTGTSIGWGGVSVKTLLLSLSKLETRHSVQLTLKGRGSKILLLEVDQRICGLW